MSEIPTNLRPSPDALLAESGATGRGRLKIFLGAAPGVGKTYEMLSAARRKHASGVDVVIGVVETHGRPETAKLLEGLAVVPRRTLEYRRRTFEELDLDAVLARRPQLVLIDELAHTNIPGSRHGKRFQDVQELLEAGIDVYSTLNVQHLESYNDLVARITGVEVRETVPDSVLKRASDVELIDLPPDDLLERLRQGKVYVPEQARNAIANFFSRGNLLALRELSFRAAAERLDEELSTYMRAHAIAGPWPTRGGLIVCIDASEASEAVVRTAKRLADQRHVPWTALYVQKIGRLLSSAEREQLETNLTLAEQLGAQSATITGLRVGTEVLEYARQHNAAQLLVGRPRGAPWRRWLRGSLAEWLVEHATGFEVTVATSDEAPMAHELRARRRALQGEEWMASLPHARELAIAAACAGAAAGVAWMLQGRLSKDNLALVFLLAVTLVSGLTGLLASLGTAVIGFLLYNLVVVQPRFTFTVARPEDATTLATFLLVAGVIGQLAARLRHQAAEARRNTSRVEVLFDFSRRIATAIDERDLLNAAARGMTELLGARALVLRSLSKSKVDVPAELARAGEFREVDQGAAEWALAHRQPAGWSTATLPGAGWHFVPVESGGQSLAVIAVEPGTAARPFGADERRLLFALAAQLAASLERYRLQRLATDARVTREAENLRSAVLGSVSRDLRAPLAALLESLRAVHDARRPLAAEELAARIGSAFEEAERLNRFVQNLLDLTRLSYGALAPHLAPVSIADTMAAARRRLAPTLRARPIEVRLAQDLPPARADPALLEEVVVNLLDNAARCSPSSVALTVTAARLEDRVAFTIANRGPRMTGEQRDRVFDLTYRAREPSESPATPGLGLPICKGFVDAMGGEISAEDGPEGTGMLITVSLPADGS